MIEQDILKKIEGAKKDFGPKCSKYIGALTVELIRDEFKREGFAVSDRDVFIKGLPIENDLMIIKPHSKPQNRILYDNKDVLAAIEIKSRGSFSKSTMEVIRKNFDLIKRSNKKIRCLYVALSERKTYKWKVTEENINSPAYTLFWHSGSEENMHFESTGDWTRLVNDIRDITI